jgi:hypothetical protein
MPQIRFDERQQAAPSPGGEGRDEGEHDFGSQPSTPDHQLFPKVPLHGNTRQYADDARFSCRVLPLKRPLIAVYFIFLPHKITLLPDRKGRLCASSLTPLTNF